MSYDSAGKEALPDVQGSLGNVQLVVVSPSGASVKKLKYIIRINNTLIIEYSPDTN